MGRSKGRANKPVVKSREVKLPLSVRYLRTIGLAGSLIGGGGVMFTSPTLFWWAAGFLYAGLAAIGLDLWFEPNLRKSPWMRRIFLAAISVLAAIFSVGIVFYPAPLTVTPISFEGRYKSGESMYGIVWDDAMSDLRIDIFNPTERDYEHLDVTITSKAVLMRDQEQITNVPGVSLLPVAHQVHLILTDENGKVTGERNVSGIAHDQLRVLCDRLPKKTVIGLIIAVSDLNPRIKEAMGPPKNGIFGARVPDPATFKIWVRRRATTVRILGNYSVLNRPYKINDMYSVKEE